VGEDSSEARVRAAVRTAAGQLVGFVSSSINHARLQLSEAVAGLTTDVQSRGAAIVGAIREAVRTAVSGR